MIYACVILLTFICRCFENMGNSGHTPFFSIAANTTFSLAIKSRICQQVHTFFCPNYLRWQAKKPVLIGRKNKWCFIGAAVWTKYIQNSWYSLNYEWIYFLLAQGQNPIFYFILQGAPCFRKWYIRCKYEKVTVSLHDINNSNRFTISLLASIYARQKLEGEPFACQWIWC